MIKGNDRIEEDVGHPASHSPFETQQYDTATLRRYFYVWYAITLDPVNSFFLFSKQLDQISHKMYVNFLRDIAIKETSSKPMFRGTPQNSKRQTLILPPPFTYFSN